MTNLDEEYEVTINGLNEDGDDEIHNTSYGFCYVPGCPCHEDPYLANGVLPDYQQGLVTSDEATNITQGKTF